MAGWHHCLKGHELELTPRESGGQRSLACCSPWGHRVWHNLATEWQPLKPPCPATVYVDVTSVSYTLALAIGTYHLPLQELQLQYVLLKLLIFNTCQEEFRLEQKWGTLAGCGDGTRQGKKYLQNRSSDMYFQKVILWAQFLYLLISRKTLKSFMVTSASCD